MDLVGHVSWGFMRMLLVLVLAPVLWRTLPSAASPEVEMAGRTQSVFQNDNATINCKIPGSPQLDIRIMGVTWFRKNQVKDTESKVFEFFGNHQEAFRPGAAVFPWKLKRGDASLQLPGVQLKEAGQYRCEVVITPNKLQGTVWLQVVARPVCGLIQDPATVKNNEEIHIVCKASGFYPQDINITWTKWTPENPQSAEISEDVRTGPPVKNEDGSYNVTSDLRLKSSLEPSVTVQCEIKHISLSTSERLNLTLPGIESQKLRIWKIALPCVVGLIIFIVLLLYFGWKRCRHRSAKLDRDTY
ncbi:natural cytotoxicity triggering receptor 3 ligand 1 [Rhinolophus sinicus]|uniref:natural cytotoxicity triggering receptor 3 ligand 1 n=1 Tax=Rhinolophus sinicus TaxID=89399 RepID=UPI003D7B71FA